MPTNLTELLVTLGLAASLAVGGILAVTAGKDQVEKKATRQVGVYAHLLESIDGER